MSCPLLSSWILLLLLLLLLLLRASLTCSSLLYCSIWSSFSVVSLSSVSSWSFSRRQCTPFSVTLPLRVLSSPAAKCTGQGSRWRGGGVEAARPVCVCHPQECWLRVMFRSFSVSRCFSGSSCESFRCQSCETHSSRLDCAITSLHVRISIPTGEAEPRTEAAALRSQRCERLSSG